MADNQQNWQYVSANEPSLEAVLRDRLVLLQLLRDGLTPRHLLALERSAKPIE